MNANAETDKKSVAARLVDMAQERYLLGVSEDGEPFGADRTRPHLAMLLRGGRAGLRADLAARYFTDTGAVAGGQALTDSTLILEGLAATKPPERLHLRVADHEGTIYIDTGRPDGQVIRIGNGRWTMTSTAPVRFLRTKLTGAMPLPPDDGDVTKLWDFVNVTAEDRPVLLAMLVAALVQCDVPHPVLGALRRARQRQEHDHAHAGRSHRPLTRSPSPSATRRRLMGDRRVRIVGGRPRQLVRNPAVAVGLVVPRRHWRRQRQTSSVHRRRSCCYQVPPVRHRQRHRRRCGPPRPRGAVGDGRTSAH